MTKLNLIRDRPPNSLSKSKNLKNVNVPPDPDLHRIGDGLLLSLSQLSKCSTLGEQIDTLKRFQGVASRWGTSLISNSSLSTPITPKHQEEASSAVTYLLAILDSDDCEDLWRSVLSALAVVTVCAGSVIQELSYSLLYSWADKLVANTSISNNEPISIRSRNLVSFLLEEPILARMVLSNTNESAYLLIRIINALVYYVAAESSSLTLDKDSSAVAALHRSDHIVVAVRELIILLPLLVMQQHRMKEITTQVEEVWALLSKECIGILSEARTNREALTSVGLVLGILTANPIQDTYENKDMKMIIARQIQELTNVNDTNTSSWFAQLQVSPRIALVRGLLIATPAEVLTLQALGGESSLLEGALFECVDQACRHSDNHIRLFALQGLETYITSARKCCSGATNDASSASSSFLLSAPVLNGIAAHVLSNWSHPFKRLSTMSTALFDQLLALVDAASATASIDEASRKKEETSENLNSTSSNVAVSATSLLLSVLAQPVGQVARYGALLRILPRIGARSMMVQRPGLIEEAFSAVSFSTEVGNIAGSFVTAFLTSLRQELEQIAGLTVGSGGVSSAVWIRGDILAKHSNEQEILIEECLSSAPENVRQIWNLASTFNDLSIESFEKQCAVAKTLVQTGTDWQQALFRQLCPADLIKRIELELVHSVVYQFWSLHWRHVFVSQLLHPFRDQRVRCATHCASRLIGLDATRRGPLNDLLTAIDKFSPSVFNNDMQVRNELSFIGDDATSLLERKLWARLQVGLFARAAGGCVLDDELMVVRAQRGGGLVSYREIARASSLPDSDTRTFALEVICMTLSPSLAPSPKEIGAALAWISSNLRAAGIATDSRKRVCRSISYLLDRTNNALHQLERASLANEKKKKKTTKKNEQPVGVTDTIDSAAEMATQLVLCGSNFVKQVISICSAALYPNAPIDRIVLPLELLSLIAEKFRSSSSSSSSTGGGSTSFSLPGKELLAELDQPKMATTLLNLCHSSHDRIRVIAFGLLEKHVSPGKSLPCHPDVSSVSSLFAWAILITQSPREREAAGGATLLSLLHARYISSLGWSVVVEFPSTGKKECIVVITSTDDAGDHESRDMKSIDFLTSLTKLLDLRMAAFRAALKRLFLLEYTSSEREERDIIERRKKTSSDNGQVDHLSNVSPLAHGLVSSLRMIMLGFSSRRGDKWKNAVANIFTSIRAAQEMALRVVAGSEESDRDAGGPDAQPLSSSSSSSSSSSTAGQSNDEFELVFKGRVDCPPSHLLSPSADLHAIGRDRPKAPLNAVHREGKNVGISTKRIDKKEDKEEVEEEEEEDESAGQYDGQDAVGDSEIIGASAANDRTNADSNLEMAHMVVVASWLLVRECVEFQGGVVGAFPLQTSSRSERIELGAEAYEEDKGDEENGWLINCADIEATGKLLLRSLLTLKHVGSIFACSEALQSICTKLHLSKGDINQCPSRWLHILLTRLTGASAAQFILRRSAGFSLAFVAILRSEPRNSAPVLLRLAMVVLLLLAGNSSDDLTKDVVGIDLFDTSSSSSSTSTATSSSSSFSLTSFTALRSANATTWRTQVHALNILRLLFRDGSLGEDVGAFVPSALRTSLRGFKSKAWAVRNSSNMLFAAALERGLGIQSQKGDEGLSTARGGGAEVDAFGAGPVSREARNRPSVSQFFSRYPTMRGVLLDELTAVTENIQALKASSETISVMSQTLTLFPTLLLLAKMRPTASLLSTSSSSSSSSPSNGYNDSILPLSESTDAFLPLIKAAACVDSAPIRRVAARALASTLPPKCAGDLAMLYISELPLALEPPRTRKVDSLTPMMRMITMNENYVHGLLLQIRTLVTSLHEEAGLHLQAHLSSLSSSLNSTLLGATEASKHTFSVLHSIHTSLNRKLEGWVPSSSSTPPGLTQSAALELVRGIAEAMITSASSIDEHAKRIASLASKQALYLCRVGSGLSADGGAITLVNSTSFGASLMLSSCADASAAAATSRLLFLCSASPPSSSSSSSSDNSSIDGTMYNVEACIDDLQQLLSHNVDDVRLASSRALKRSIKHAAASVNAILVNVYSSRSQGTASFESQRAEKIGAANTASFVLQHALTQPAGKSLFRLILDRLRSGENHPGVMRRLFRSAALLGVAATTSHGGDNGSVYSTLAQFKSLVADSFSEQDSLWSDLLRIHDETRDASAKSQAIVLLGLFTSSFISSLMDGNGCDDSRRTLLFKESIDRIGSAAENVASFEARNSAAFCLSHGNSILLRAGLMQSIEPSISSLACQRLWPRALELIVDTDDEVREAARHSIATAMSCMFGSIEGGLETLSHTTALLLSKVPDAIAYLLPPVSAFLTEVPNSDFHHHNIDLPLADEATTIILGVAALVCCFNNCCSAMRESKDDDTDKDGARASNRALLASTVLSVFSGGCLPVINGTVELIAIAKKDVEEGQDEDKDETENEGNHISSAAKGGDSNAMPFNTRLLKRPMFQSDNMNEYAEPLVQGILFAAAWSICCEAVTDRDIVSTRGLLFSSTSAMEVINIAAKVTSAASDVDIGLLLDPVLGHEGPWMANDGIDDAPLIFAGCKTAEVIMSANSF